MDTRFLGLIEMNLEKGFFYVNEQMPYRPLYRRPNISNLEILVLEVYKNNRK